MDIAFILGALVNFSGPHAWNVAAFQKEPNVEALKEDYYM